MTTDARGANDHHARTEVARVAGAAAMAAPAKAVDPGLALRDIVSKPFDKNELLARVKSLIRVKSYHDDVVAALDCAEVGADEPALELWQVPPCLAAARTCTTDS